MANKNYMEFIENNEWEVERFVTFVEITDENKDDLDRLKNLFDRIDLDHISMNVAPEEINEDFVKIMNRYDTNGYMKGFVISDLNKSVIERLDEFEKMDDHDLAETLDELFYKRGAFSY